MNLIDLHTHSTASDGTLSPAALAAEAARAGLAAVALTDHDTVEGLPEFLSAARPDGPELVPGVEISTQRPGGGPMHLVGLWVDPHDPGLSEGLAWMQQARLERNPKIAAKLQGLGLDITLEEVAALASGQVGRPHFAQALVEKGLVNNTSEAFSRYLKRGAPGYVEKERMSPEQALSLIRGAGGLPVLAHPALLEMSPAVLEALLLRLKEHGLEALEAHYSQHDAAQVRSFKGLAARLGLAVSGGSDFHGANKPDIRLGVGMGTLRAPKELLAGLKERLT
ncbi:MAG: PHP domain-containing protein [Desulfarculaceae bacterium]|nr:PHP domain-containing protein [Desulfarculaceae bacterium]MCF8074225.1 PHP domain-containing protein [Desulfarculaceae bacterium]MCF8103016.1 PHP domain-containing protein [Desulfarculaceae bacterium]MCF8117147.1 PHP domain-containing protein [Desulfarculaceae bacterium]